jgi:hypothetical protein
MIPKTKLNIDHLTDLQFEELCCEILSGLGYRKKLSKDSEKCVEWEITQKDPDGEEYIEKALVDFKYYKNKKGFPKQALEDLFYRTTAKGADVAFFIVSSSITPAITKWLDKYKKNINSRVRIKIWSGAEIETLVVKNPEFINNLDIRVTLMKPLITPSLFMHKEPKTMKSFECYSMHLVLIMRGRLDILWTANSR